MSKLLINEPPLIVIPSLVHYVGLNEAIVLQQVHYWISNPKIGKQVEGKNWVRNSLKEWREDNFSFWSEKTIRKAFKNLEEDQLIETRDDLNKLGYDRTKWYTVNYDALNTLDRPTNRHWSKAKGGVLPGREGGYSLVGSNKSPGREYQTVDQGLTVPETTPLTTPLTTEPLENIFNLQGQEHSESSAPYPKDQFWGYRDAFLEIYQETTGSIPDLTSKGDIADLGYEDDADLDLWKKSIQTAYRRYQGKGRPSVERMINIYRCKDDYQAAMQIEFPQTKNGQPEPTEFQQFPDGGFYG